MGMYGYHGNYFDDDDDDVFWAFFVSQISVKLLLEAFPSAVSHKYLLLIKSSNFGTTLSIKVGKSR